MIELYALKCTNHEGEVGYLDFVNYKQDLREFWDVPECFNEENLCSCLGQAEGIKNSCIEREIAECGEALSYYEVVTLTLKV